jgi:predicted amidohydrolase YtcJ
MILYKNNMNHSDSAPNNPGRPKRWRLTAACLLLTVTRLCLGATQPADTVLLHGHIYTANPQQRWVEALAIRGDSILAVGTTAEIEKLRSPSTKVVELAGRMVMPGIIDDHTHFIWGSAGLVGVQLATARTVAEVKERLSAFAKAHPSDTFVYGAGWQYGFFPPSGLPTKEMLDQYFPNRPVEIMSGDGHSLWVNTKALNMAGITRDTPDPSGESHGIIIHDAKGEPTGVLEESAKQLIMAKLPFSHEQKVAFLKVGMREANSHGVTSVVNATGDIPEMELYRELHQKDLLTVRMTTAFAVDVGVKHTLSPAELASFEEARKRFHTGDWVRAGVIKFFADGVIETHTAAMLQPYANKPGDSGTTLYTPEQFRKYFLELDKRGFQVMTHSIGDGAVRTVLDAYQYVEKTDGPRDRRWRVEHIETIHPNDVPRFAQQHVIASIQPWCCPHEDKPWADNVGPHIADTEGLRWHDIEAANATVALGSDWPVTPLNPFPTMELSITRQGGAGKAHPPFHLDQAFTLEQVLDGYTRNSAYAEFMDQRLGTLKPGMLADLIVLSQDLSKIPPSKIGQTKVLLTLVGGKEVWRGSM